jgi:hypothetical protein
LEALRFALSLSNILLSLKSDFDPAAPLFHSFSHLRVID